MTFSVPSPSSRPLLDFAGKRVVLADVPPERKPERGYVRMFPRNENRNEGTFACSAGTRVHSPKPPFYETALLSPSDLRDMRDVRTCNVTEIGLSCCVCRTDISEVLPCKAAHHGRMTLRLSVQLLVATIDFSPFTCCFRKFLRRSFTGFFCSENAEFTESLLCSLFTI